MACRWEASRGPAPPREASDEGGPKRSLLGPGSLTAPPRLQLVHDSAAPGNLVELRLRAPCCGRCAARLSLRAASRGCAARLWWLWLPIARFVSLLCCCLHPARALAIVAMRELLARCCAGLCGRRRRSAARAARPGRTKIHNSSSDGGGADGLAPLPSDSAVAVVSTRL